MNNNNKINLINKKNKTFSSDILLENSLRMINNSCSIGSNILIELDDQYNKLESTNDILESDEYLLNKALKTIRNMTWSGMIWNLINSEPIETSKNINLEKKINEKNISKSYISNDNKKKLFEDKLDKINYQTNKINYQTNKTKQDEYLDQISLKLDELHGISIKIGIDLENENNLIEQIDTNTEIITNKMLKVDLETKKITNSHKKLDYKLIGKFNLVDLESGLALSTDELGSIRLTNKIDFSTIFECYSTSNNIYSIQNYKTQKYLKTDFFGNVGFTGNYIGTYEQCFLNLLVEESDLKSESKSDSKSDSKNNIYSPTGILILSKNNYHGGWLKKPKLNTELEINNDLFITNTTPNTTDTTDMIIFQPIKLD